MDRRSLLETIGVVSLAALWPSSVGAAFPRMIDPFEHGAKGDGRSDDRAAIQRAIDACAAAGGGTVMLAAGRTFLSGGLELRSHVVLHLAAGATLKASPDRKSYGDRGALVFARDADGCGVEGSGTIDGDYRSFLTPKPGGGYEPSYTFLGRYDPERVVGVTPRADGRPRVMLFVGCRRVVLERFRIVGAPSWTIHLLGCQDVAVDRITITNELTVPNCDGIDVDRCRRVRISNCEIMAGDDGICLKASLTFPQFGACEDVTVTGCTITSGSSGIKLGSAALSPIRNLVVTGCVISGTNRGVALQNRDGSVYENIMFSDLVIATRYYPAEWWGAAEPIHISNLPRRRELESAGLIRGISFDNIRCVGESGIFIHGAPGSPIEDVAFRGVTVDIGKIGQELGGFYDLRPSWRYPEVHRSTVAGVHAEGIDGLTLAHVAVRFRSPIHASYGPALWTRRVTRLDAERFQGRAARPGVPDRVEA